MPEKTLYYVDFTGYCEIEANNEAEVKTKFFNMMKKTHNSTLQFNDDETIISYKCKKQNNKKRNQYYRKK